MVVSQADLRNRANLLNKNEKLYVNQVRKFLTFDSAYCITNRRYAKIPDIHAQVKDVFDQKCKVVDMADDRFKDVLPHLMYREANLQLMKASLPLANATGSATVKGSTLWNAFKNMKCELLNVWMPNYNLMSGETFDNDEATVARMMPYVWLNAKTKANAVIRNREKKKQAAGQDVKPTPDPSLADYKAGDYHSPLLLTFHLFKRNKIVLRKVGGTAASPVPLDEDEVDENKENAQPETWDLVCKNRIDQRKVARGLKKKKMKQKREDDAQQEDAKRKDKRAKVRNLKRVATSMNHANQLQIAQFFQSIGNTKRALEIVTSVDSVMNRRGGRKEPAESSNEPADSDGDSDGDSNEDSDDNLDDNLDDNSDDNLDANSDEDSDKDTGGAEENLEEESTEVVDGDNIYE